MKKTKIIIKHPVVAAHWLKHVPTRGAVTRGLWPARGVRRGGTRVLTTGSGRAVAVILEL